jgi:hypothetical protein
MVYMSHLGLPLLPSSVLVKSSASSSAIGSDLGGTLAGLLGNTIWSLSSRWGILFAISAVVLLPAALKQGAHSYLAKVAAIALMAHVVGGRVGDSILFANGRYGVYCVVLVVLAVAYYYSDRILSLPVGARFPVVSAALLILAVPFIHTAALTPAASQNIYQQQFQMHRFATKFFPRRVAVNDLGWVSYRNDDYVLDLWGLGSEEARQAMQVDGRTPEFMRTITSRHYVVYAMIYDEWFVGAVPSEWCRIGELRTSQIASAAGSVAFYLLSPGEEAGMRSALADFEMDLPEGASLQTFDCSELQDGPGQTS